MSEAVDLEGLGSDSSTRLAYKRGPFVHWRVRFLFTIEESAGAPWRVMASVVWTRRLAESNRGIKVPGKQNSEGACSGEAPGGA